MVNGSSDHRSRIPRGLSGVADGEVCALGRGRGMVATAPARLDRSWLSAAPVTRSEWFGNATRARSGRARSEPPGLEGAGR